MGIQAAYPAPVELIGPYRVDLQLGTAGPPGDVSSPAFSSAFGLRAFERHAVVV